ncbi:PSP1 domain protein [Rhodothermus marinus SG0.5JP17-172]|uniref:PSP1 domain-containing protein n=1 Tax=Rhodothermus marinus TaxID=29549 RepID=UPI000223DB26|nr:regulatory iron-sulfur-containing complex subunit RicT [Rhodothermus marinus]AEN72560.1 PSP1 domain protein [Rhodothermus marinus SG0.5JP17-172]MBO2492762.1 Signal peptidase-like protein [Rhodothermus marinus]
MACGSACVQGGGCGGGCASGNGCPSLHVFDWLSHLSGPYPTYDIVEVRFKGRRKGLYRNVDRMDLQAGDYVIVEADRGVHFGIVHLTGELVRLRVRAKGLDDDAEFPRIVRLATLDDIDRWEANKQQEIEAFYIAREAIERLGLPMKLVDAEWQFDHKKITFYFTADHRVDFRQLVRELARTFRTRVELRQIGARDEAARIGGIGSCGRELCCSTWLQEFKPVATQTAKIQNLPLNPARLSGQCGRLKCCLNYELEQYMAALKDFPPVDTPVETERGRGTVQKLDIFKRRVWIQYEDGNWEDMALEDVQPYLRPRTSAGKS